ncbi:uncharacterized protein FIBRA_03106 [Fibroporia radiculosa]|uniref:Enoyl reductase (ER) domain-containing protein n=1 Tax=Fibroporia radiculosa TaxID=599839 RepID=J4G467_9APHY|nr:uncharacterized protein FIBRA_03106 [Fibroporia radiculosa]CCM01058.1 predicted protein [Fibroporia radiculosa]
MPIVTNARVLFNDVPKGYPEPGRTTVYDTSLEIDVEKTLPDGGFLIKTLVLAIDPYMRHRMRDRTVKSYMPAFERGQPLENFGVGVVLRSEHSSVSAGDHLYGLFPFQEYFVSKDPGPFRVLDNKEHLPWSTYVGVCGMPGQTAHHGWREYARPKKGDVVFVTAGAGTVGATVIQLAKMQGLKVIASVGSEEKVSFISSIGANVAFNYKTDSTLDILEKEGPINMHVPSSSGESLEAALETAAVDACFIECGMISGYNEEPYYVKNLDRIFKQGIQLCGFAVLRLQKWDDEFYKTIPGMVSRGEIQYSENVKRGLEHVGQAILDVQVGRNKGRTVILVQDE